VTRRGWLLFSTMCVLWGIPYLLIKVAVEDLSPPVVVLARTGIGAAVLLPVAAARGYLRPLLPCWRWLLAFTVLEIAGPWLLLTDAERHLTSSLTGLLVAAVPMVAAVASLALGEQDRLDRTRVVGLVVGMAGVAVLLGLDLGGEVRAALELAVVVVGYGTAPLIVSRRLADVPSLGVIAASLGITAVAYAPVAALSWPSQVLTSVVVLALACTVAAFLVFFALIVESGPNRALVITFVNPAVALLLGVVLLGESFTAGAAVGFPLVLLGCVLATRPSAARLPAVAEP
jgi:drug/metabolite transporter (DMT)-like permease